MSSGIYKHSRLMLRALRAVGVEPRCHLCGYDGREGESKTRLIPVSEGRWICDKAKACQNRRRKRRRQAEPHDFPSQ